MVEDYNAQGVQAIPQLSRVPGTQDTVLQRKVLPCYLAPTNRVIANAVLHLVVVEVTHPRAAVDGHDAFHDIAIAGLRDFHTWWSGVYGTDFNRWLGLAVGFRPGAVLGWVHFKVLRSHHVLRAKFAGAFATHGT